MSTAKMSNAEIQKYLDALHPDLRFDPEWHEAGLFVMIPHTEMPDSIEEARTNKRTPQGQVRLLGNLVGKAFEDTGLRTLLYDGVTETGERLTNEYARIKVNKNDTSKHYTVKDGESGDIFFNVPGVNWADNGMAQRELRMGFRDSILSRLKGHNVMFIGHSIYRDKEGKVGIDAGGPAGMERFLAPLPNVFYVGRSEKGIGVHTSRFQHPEHMAPVLAKTNRPPGTKLDPVYPIPLDDFEANVQLWEKLMVGLRTFTGAIIGDVGVGKTAFASAFLGLPIAKPALVVMADGQDDLPSFWPQVKEARV